MIKFLESYGVLVSVGFSFLFLIIGWFILLNGTKYITSRNESKSTLNELNNILDDACKDSTEFWSNFSTKSPSEKKAFYKNGTVLSVQIKRYKTLLSNYGIDVLESDSTRRIKENLTLGPSNNELGDAKRLAVFMENKTYVANTLFNKVILDNNYSFMKLHKPVHEPILDKFRLFLPRFGAWAGGCVFGVVVLGVYFYIGSKIYPL